MKIEDELLLIFKKPYTFEGKEYAEVDLSGMENLTAKDLADADKMFISSNQIAVMNESSLGYACIIAHKVTKLPVEFFENLPAKEAIKLRNTVSNFFYR